MAPSCFRASGSPRVVPPRAPRLREKSCREKAGRQESPREIKNGGTKGMRRIERMREPLETPLPMSEPGL